MPFDIYEFDKLEGWDDQEIEEYQDTLLELFYESPEGHAHLKDNPDMGFWAAQLMHYGYGYEGLTLSMMTADDVENILVDFFPRKISLSSPDEAEDALPELIAFWEYLKREYSLPNADEILNLLEDIDVEDFKQAMFDPSNFGMAKSFFMMGQAAGFDMTDNDQMNAFMHLYNAQAVAQSRDNSGSAQEPYDLLDSIQGMGAGSPKLEAKNERSKHKKAKEKRKRRQAKASRKRNRK